VEITNQLRRIADRLDGEDAKTVWRAAKQLESLHTALGHVDESPETPCTLQQARDRGEKRRLLAVLLEVCGNRSWAADRLKISRTAFYKALRKHGLRPPG
jgi:transcriptional regulator of acetoin/glycerol metabolism